MKIKSLLTALAAALPLLVFAQGNKADTTGQCAYSPSQERVPFMLTPPMEVVTYSGTLQLIAEVGDSVMGYLLQPDGQRVAFTAKGDAKAFDKDALKMGMEVMLIGKYTKNTKIAYTGGGVQPVPSVELLCLFAN